MSETTFENAKVGDRVWDFQFGWGNIKNILHESYPIKVAFDNGSNEAFTFSGHYLQRVGRTLFWSEIKYEVPTRPKRKVKKEVRGWVNVYPNSMLMYGVYTTREGADKAADLTYRIACVEVSGEYEVEE